MAVFIEKSILNFKNNENLISLEYSRLLMFSHQITMTFLYFVTFYFYFCFVFNWYNSIFTLQQLHNLLIVS